MGVEQGARMSNDPYEALGLTKAATADDVKKAYRKLVRTSHPDLHPDRLKLRKGGQRLLHDLRHGF